MWAVRNKKHEQNTGLKTTVRYGQKIPRCTWSAVFLFVLTYFHMISINHEHVACGKIPVYEAFSRKVLLYVNMISFSKSSVSAYHSNAHLDSEVEQLADRHYHGVVDRFAALRFPISNAVFNQLKRLCLGDCEPFYEGGRIPGPNTRVGPLSGIQDRREVGNTIWGFEMSKKVS